MYPQSMKVHTRSGTGTVEKPFEKPVILPSEDEKDPAQHAWADARFATDIMSEHGLFFALLMPPEVAPDERTQALDFSKRFSALYERIDSAGPPDKGDLKGFIKDVVEEIKPFIEYKHIQGEAQESGKLHSLVWPLFFEHTRAEAERHVSRLQQLADGDSGFDRKEVTVFWNNIMDEHARFVAHLLDPDEFEVIEEATRRAGCSDNWTVVAWEGRPRPSSPSRAWSRRP
jgi:hypothetical protein